MDLKLSQTKKEQENGSLRLLDGPVRKNSMDHLHTANSRKRSSETCVVSCSLASPELVSSDFKNSTQDLKNHEEKKKSLKSVLPEIFASTAATSLLLAAGMCYATTSALVVDLKKPDSELQASTSELAWIVSVASITIPVVSFFVGILMESFGRLNVIKLSIIPAVASCALIALATNATMIIGGRVLFGIASVLGINPGTVYVSEITSPEYRGPLLSSGLNLTSIGMLLGYIMGAFLPWRLVSWIVLVFCLIPVTLIVLFSLPESPPWLVSKNEIERARNSLVWLHKFEDERNKEKLVEGKLKELLADKEKKLAAKRGESSVWKKYSGLIKQTGYKPMIIMIVLFFFQQFTGVYIATFNIVQYFENAGSKMNPFHASILLGSIRFFLSIVVVYTHKRVGRRPLCLVSCLGMGVCSAISGYVSRQVEITGESSMVPVITISLYIAFATFGLLPLPWAMSAEVFPTEIRGLANGVVMASAFILLFIATFLYYDMEEFFHGHDGLQWFFTVMCAIAFVYIYFFLPETHGKTLLEIESYFEENFIYSPTKIKRSKLNTSRTKAADRKISIATSSAGETLLGNGSEHASSAIISDENSQTVTEEDSKMIGDTELRKT